LSDLLDEQRLLGVGRIPGLFEIFVQLLVVIRIFAWDDELLRVR
jgi:hypothetical protein